MAARGHVPYTTSLSDYGQVHMDYTEAPALLDPMPCCDAFEYTHFNERFEHWLMYVH